MHPQVPYDFLDTVVRKVAIAAMKLKALIRHPAPGFRDKLLCHGAALRRIGLAVVQRPGGMAQEGSRGLEVDLHVSQTKLQRLELVDGLPEGLRSLI